MKVKITCRYNKDSVIDLYKILLHIFVHKQKVNRLYISNFI